MTLIKGTTKNILTCLETTNKKLKNFKTVTFNSTILKYFITFLKDKCVHVLIQQPLKYLQYSGKEEH